MTEVKNVVMSTRRVHILDDDELPPEVPAEKVYASTAIGLALLTMTCTGLMLFLGLVSACKSGDTLFNLGGVTYKCVKSEAESK